MRGRRPKPTQLKVLTGNPGRRPINEDEPKPAKKIPPCPGWLPAYAKKEWRRVAGKLFRLGLLTELDMVPLAMYCLHWARVYEAETAIKKFGTTLVTDKGNTVQRPEVGISNTSMAHLRALCAEFGMTPSSRGRMHPGSTDEEADETAALLDEMA